MERIKQALERAQAAREEAAAPVRQPGALHALDDARTRTHPFSNSDEMPERDVDGITYTQTRLIEVSDEMRERNRVISGVGTDALNESYKVLRTRVLQSLSLNNWNSFAVTSPGDGEGKTTTAINLAISLAMEVNHTVLLVDLNLRQPAIAERFGFTPEIGLTDVLFSGKSLGDALVNPGIEGLVVLPCREAQINSSEILSSPRMVRLVEDLKTRYPSRIVVFDMPSLQSGDDVLAFCPYVDALLLVCADGVTRKSDLTRIREMLAGKPILGTVLNQAGDLKAARGSG